ncbi:transcriptional regulator [Streptococcus mitis]|uniref:Transcriptional regulator n=1 Tax=Streptococcus mitis TaxID=28037 RepID=A0A0F2DBW8_STRMT|nr:helix-turn-helix transcriptional regulator [Streptococcus mitis]KJQ68418.1 transcriptional regulator [Streptococcus mitis]
MKKMKKLKSDKKVLTNKNNYGKLKLTKMKNAGDFLGNRIEEYRKPLGLSQHRLGKKIGISRISINKIETGKTTPTLKIANDIANALGVCIYQVFDLDGTGNYRCLNCNCGNI